MAQRKTQNPTRIYADTSSGYHDEGDYTETHPAFGVAIVSRGSGSGRALFQSDLLHNETITLTIQRAERGRSLLHDWVHPRRSLVEVEMSLAQWGALVSSIGIGSGVPVTIRATEDEYSIPALPYEPRIAESLDEVRGATTKLMEGIRKHYTKVREAFDGKKGVKAQREALDSLGHALNNTESNQAFAVTSLTRAAESVTSQAKADIEAHILAAAQITGLTAPIHVPALGRTAHDDAREWAEKVVTALDDFDLSNGGV